jgi:hypothetical protein
VFVGPSSINARGETGFARSDSVAAPLESLASIAPEHGFMGTQWRDHGAETVLVRFCVVEAGFAYVPIKSTVSAGISVAGV